MDMPEVRERWPQILEALKRRGLKGEAEPMLISAITGENVRQLLYRAAQRLLETPPLEEMEMETVPVYRMVEDPRHFTIEHTAGGWRVHGKAIERSAAMTYWEFDASVRRFQRILKTLGIEDALRKAGVEEGEIVFIGEYELEWQD